MKGAARTAGSRIYLGDDGSLDTVIYCGKCKAEERFNFEGEAPSSWRRQKRIVIVTAILSRSKLARIPGRA
jgi:hypothetical protein